MHADFTSSTLGCKLDPQPVLGEIAAVTKESGFILRADCRVAMLTFHTRKPAVSQLGIMHHTAGIDLGVYTHTTPMGFITFFRQMFLFYVILAFFFFSDLGSWVEYVPSFCLESVLGPSYPFFSIGTHAQGFVPTVAVITQLRPCLCVWLNVLSPFEAPEV